jgi:hypothetical protein
MIVFVQDLQGVSMKDLRIDTTVSAMATDAMTSPIGPVAALTPEVIATAKKLEAERIAVERKRAEAEAEFAKKKAELKRAQDEKVEQLVAKIKGTSAASVAPSPDSLKSDHTLSNFDRHLIACGFGRESLATVVYASSLSPVEARETYAKLVSHLSIRPLP